MFRQLELMLALHREQHFGRASEACGVSQPTLSNAIRALEERLGMILVQRTNRFTGFTPEGERVVVWARRILGDVQGMQEELAAFRGGLKGHLRIAAIPTALPMVVWFTTPFRANYPGVEFTIISRNSAEILRHIENMEVDAGLGYIANEPTGAVRTLPVYHERYHLLTGESSRFEGRTSVSWAEVAILPLCLLTQDMQNRRIIDQLLSDTGIEVRPTLESNSVIVLFSHIYSGQWSSVMPRSLTDSVGLPPGIRSLPIVEPEVSHAIGLLVSDRDPMPPQVAALLAIGRQVADRLQQNGQ